MKKVISKARIPIKMWLDDAESGAIDQAIQAANLPFAFKHIALMPDAHEGYGVPIGCVLATDGVIIPNAVGVDIGCGMIAVQTNLEAEAVTSDRLKQVLGGAKDNPGGVRSRIPVGFSKHKDPRVHALFEHHIEDIAIVKQERGNAALQLGTLGGGNHFIEFQKGSDGYLWYMIHSGSRNIGLKIAQEYHKLAVRLNEQWASGVPKDLSFLPMSSTEGKEYFTAMTWAKDYARANRAEMAWEVLTQLKIVFPDIGIDDVVHIPHNYAVPETHFGKEVIVHRKGATSAKEGELGVIPGSQGTNSYIVKGLGNPMSFNSCSHGAGRTMSRKKAKEELDLDTVIAEMDAKGIVHGIRHKNDLDEAPGAYKDISKVMNNQKDLVKVLVELTPLAVVKA